MAKLPCHLQFSVAATLAVLSLAHLASSSSPSSSSSSHRHHRRSSLPPDSHNGQDDPHSTPLPDPVNQGQGHCDSCPTRNDQKEARTEFLKQKILKQLGMQAPPNVTFNRKVIPAIPDLSRAMDRYEMQGMAPYHHYRSSHRDDEYDDQRKALTKLLIPLPPPDFVPRSNNETDIYFRFHSDLLASHVSLAKLHVYIRGTTSEESGAALLMIQVISSDGSANVVRKKRLTGGGKPLGEWVTFNIRSQVRHWLSHPASNLGLRIEAIDAAGNNLALVRPRTQDQEAYVPVLELKDAPPSRRRRDMAEGLRCRENSTETECCLFPLRVDFSKFGWDWIIAPRKYTANYCSGKCGFLFKTTHRVSHIVQQSIPSNQLHAGPCCAPRKLAPLHLVYFSEEQQIIWGRLAGMIVMECGCA